jgi:hypothetical protein
MNTEKNYVILGASSIMIVAGVLLVAKAAKESKYIHASFGFLAIGLGISILKFSSNKIDEENGK